MCGCGEEGTDQEAGAKLISVASLLAASCWMSTLEPVCNREPRAVGWKMLESPNPVTYMSSFFISATPENCSESTVARTIWDIHLAGASLGEVFQCYYAEPSLVNP